MSVQMLANTWLRDTCPKQIMTVMHLGLSCDIWHHDNTFRLTGLTKWADNYFLQQQARSHTYWNCTQFSVRHLLLLNSWEGLAGNGGQCRLGSGQGASALFDVID